MEGSLFLPGTQSVSRFEAEDVRHRNAIQMAPDAPRRQDFGVDEFVDRLATELPAAAQLRDGHPGGIRRHRDRVRGVSSLARSGRVRSTFSHWGEGDRTCFSLNVQG